MLEGKNILLGVSASIAIYKACELISVLKEKKANIRVAMTREAASWISPVVFKALTNAPVYVDHLGDLEGTKEDTNITHIKLSEWADAILVAPATANIIAKIAHGLADDAVSVISLATRANKIIAPAMNSNMYENPITMRNMDILKENGWVFADATVGVLACMRKGIGHLAGCKDIIEVVDSTFYPKNLNGLRVIVTAGPTRESIDPVRFVSNHSSGKMGFDLAKTAAKMGADVTLVTGPVSLKTPPLITERIDVESSEDMLRVLDKLLSEETGNVLLIMAAAVADFKPESTMDNKLKKSDVGNKLHLNLIKTTDIAKTIKSIHPHVHVVGFAAETQDIHKNGLLKLKEKGMDVIVINDVSRRDIGFGSNYNEVTMVFKNGKMEYLKKDTKENIAFEILRRIEI